MTSPSPTTAPTPGATHTSGPWRVLGDGVTVAQDRKTHRVHVCRAFEIYGVRAEREANAALIAAAPTMAEALQMILKRSRVGSDIAIIARSALNLTVARSTITEAETPREGRP